MELVADQHIVADDEDGEETFHNDLIDQSEYPTVKELVDDIIWNIQC